MPAYALDQGLKDLGNQIIKADRPHLANMKIGYMFRPEAPVSRGRVTAGMCIRCDDRNRTIHGMDFIIEIGKDVWEDAPSNDFRRALLDHELGHCGVKLDEHGEVEYEEKTGRPKTYLRHHDIEEFEEVLERHGSYHKGLREFLEAYARHKKMRDSDPEAE